MSSKGIISVAMVLTEQQARDILRFCDTCEDGQGYDVPKDRMKSLARLGLIRTTGFSRYEITDAGDAVIEGLRAQLDAPAVKYGPTSGCKQCQEAEDCGLTDCPECDAKLSEDVDGTGVRPAVQPQGETPDDDKSHPRFIAGYKSGIHDQKTNLAQSEPVMWGAPKTVGQLIRQLETLDQDLRPLSMLRVPGDVFDDGKERIRALHLSISHERVDGQWLAPFKSDCEKVLAFWCRMEKTAPLMADDREKAIDEISAAINRMPYTRQHLAECLYDAGYRKQVAQ